MPLFNSPRDSGFLKSINKEIVQKIISMEVALYKISIEETEVNIYGESDKKIFYHPIRLYSVIRPNEKTSNNTMDVLDYQKSYKFSFIKQELEEKQVVVEEGDFIFYDGKYFEVDQVSNSKYWSGRNPNQALGITEDEHTLYGYDYSIEAEAHQTSAPEFLSQRQGSELVRIKGMD